MQAITVTTPAAEGNQTALSWTWETAGARFRRANFGHFASPSRAGVCDFDAFGVAWADLQSRLPGGVHTLMGLRALLANELKLFD